MEARYARWAKGQPRPALGLVEQIESLLANEPCVGDLRTWSRFYAYDFLPEKMVDSGIVDFHLEQVGSYGVQQGRKITEPDSWVNLDDRPIRMVNGDYDIREQRLRIEFCGNNVGARQPGDIYDKAYNEDLKRRRVAHGTATTS
jgi:hypothetical protein